MQSYLEWVEGTRLVEFMDAAITSGDSEDYPGTAVEVRAGQRGHEEFCGEQLFDVVLDSDGNKFVLFCPHKDCYRLRLDELREILETANEKVIFHQWDDEQGWTVVPGR